MTNNVGLTLSVGDTTLQFTISIEQDNKNCDTKYHIQCTYIIWAKNDILGKIIIVTQNSTW